MKVLVFIVFVVLLDSINSLEEAISSTEHYSDVPCGVNNSRIIVTRVVDNKREHCEGHLIHEQAALIPAQCLDGYGTYENPIQIAIISNGTMVEHQATSNTFVHPNYDPCFGLNNFAIVTFDTSFTVDHDIICMPDQKEITAWSIKSCDTSHRNYVTNNLKHKEQCRDRIATYDYYGPENGGRIVHKMKKEKYLDVYEISYSQLFTCDFEYKGINHSYIYASTFYATVDAGNEDEYYMVYRQDYVREIIPWVTDVMTSTFMYK